MMRRTVLLMVTTALALIAAGGIALAATTFTCTTDPCEGTTDDDVITGTLNAETINSKAGNDEISARDANDTLNGEDGNDTIRGELGDDILAGGAGNDTIDGGEGNDRYDFSDNFGLDRIEADSSGVDTIDLSRISIPDGTNPSTNGVAVDLMGPDPLCSSTQSLCISLGGEFIENLVGTPFGDYLTGNSLNNTIKGGDGNERINGGGGNDDLQGGSGLDILFGDAGNDTLDGGEGTDDVYYLTSNWGSDTVVEPVTTPPPYYGEWVAADNTSDTPTLPLIFNLVSGPGPEVTDGTNTMNWENNVIGRAQGGPAGDTFIQNSSNNIMNGYQGGDTYKGYGPGGPASGFDRIQELDSYTGATDKLDLTNFDLADVSKWETAAGSAGGTANDKSLVITFADGSKITIVNYFDLTGAADVCTGKQGKWYMEIISFADDPNVDFAQVKSLLGCPSDTTPPTVNTTSPVDNATGTDSTANVSATFSEQMDPGTLTTSTFTLTKQGTTSPLAATVGYDLTNNNATLNPSSDLEANSTYTVTIKGGSEGVKDLAGNALEQDYSWSFTTAPDTTPPETTIASGPSGYVKSTSASFSFLSSESGSTFQCSRDGSTFSACTSPKSYPGPLSQGSHTFRVRAIDKAGNIDATPASRSWFVDNVDPKGTISINGGNASTSSRSVTLKLSASDPSPASGVASMRFRNGVTDTWSSWFDYSTSKSWTLTAGAGTKTVYVQYKDRADNISTAASDTIKFSP
jgi:Bacterial Ig-like domain/RTX calcium-binding nonapeptide repeat (4 copies)